MKRVCIYPKDVSMLTGKSLRSSQKMLKNLRLILKKRKEQYITIEEFADHTGINIEIIKKNSFIT